MQDHHHWTEDDDIVAFYLSHCQGIRFLGVGLETIAKILSRKQPPPGYRQAPMSAYSLSKRVANFEYLAGRPGLSNFARQSQHVYERYKSASILDLRPVVIAILDLK